MGFETKKIIITVVVSFLVIISLVGTFFGVRAYLQDRKADEQGENLQTIEQSEIETQKETTTKKQEKKPEKKRDTKEETTTEPKEEAPTEAPKQTTQEPPKIKTYEEVDEKDNKKDKEDKEDDILTKEDLDALMNKDKPQGTSSEEETEPSEENEEGKLPVSGESYSSDNPDEEEETEPSQSEETQPTEPEPTEPEPTEPEPTEPEPTETEPTEAPTQPTAPENNDDNTPLIGYDKDGIPHVHQREQREKEYIKNYSDIIYLEVARNLGFEQQVELLSKEVLAAHKTKTFITPVYSYSFDNVVVDLEGEEFKELYILSGPSLYQFLDSEMNNYEIKAEEIAYGSIVIGFKEGYNYAAGQGQTKILVFSDPWSEVEQSLLEEIDYTFPEQ